jgi:hypothetical protein
VKTTTFKKDSCFPADIAGSLMTAQQFLEKNYQLVSLTYIGVLCSILLTGLKK